MLAITQLRCYKNFKPMRIVNVLKKGKPSDLYSVLGANEKSVGRFRFLVNKSSVSSYGVLSDGEVCDLFLDKSIRRKQSSVNALFSILEFAKELAKQKKLDVVTFCAKKNNKNHTVRLYRKVTPYEENHLLTKWFSFPITEAGKKVLDQRLQSLEFFPDPLNLFSAF